MGRALHSSGILRSSRLLWIASKQVQANGVSFTTNRRILRSSVGVWTRLNVPPQVDPRTTNAALLCA